MAKENLEAGEVEALLNELETKMGRLRAIYEQYFMGIERMPPTTLRKDVVRLIHRIENLYIRNTALKFRSRSLVQRFTSYKTYWSRTERQIEEGTYIRDIRRAERNNDRRRSRQDRTSGADEDGVIDIDMDEIVDLRELEIELEALDIGGAFDEQPRLPNEPVMPDDSEARRRAKLAEIAGALGIEKTPRAQPEPQPAPSAQPQPTRSAPVSLGNKREKLADIKRRMAERGAPVSASASTPRPTPTASGGGDDARRVYDQLVEAKRRCNESTDNLSYESVAKSIEKQRAHIKQTRGSEVDFKVVIKDGRAFIKPETK